MNKQLIILRRGLIEFAREICQKVSIKNCGEGVAGEGTLKHEIGRRAYVKLETTGF
jgi:hypothetical protein